MVKEAQQLFKNINFVLRLAECVSLKYIFIATYRLYFGFLF